MRAKHMVPLKSNHQHYLAWEYHQPAFHLLFRIHENEIRHELIKRYARVRADLILSEFKPDTKYSGKDAWPIVRRLLDQLEAHVIPIARRRTFPYWLHIYRRIGVMLSPEHESITDSTTVGLVRGIAEIFMQKYGAINGSKEFGISGVLSPDLVLGGWMKKGIRSITSKGNRSEERAYKDFISFNYKKKRSTVIRSFTKKDFLDVHRMEGIAYQYWRLTALLRSLGKGVDVMFDSEGGWAYKESTQMAGLIRSIDARNLSLNSFSSLLGVWIDQEYIASPESRSDASVKANSIVIPLYNTNRSERGYAFEEAGIKIAQNTIFNFCPAIIRTEDFLKSHEFMEVEFFERRGFSLESFVFVLVALSSFIPVPESVLHEVDGRKRAVATKKGFLQLMKRGYIVFRCSVDDLVEKVHVRSKLLFNELYKHEDVDRAIRSLILDANYRDKSSAWTRGPRAMIIGSEESCFVDFVGVPSNLVGLFSFLRDGEGRRGKVFEKLFRTALTNRKCSVHSGKRIARDGTSRELDAGVVYENRLYLFECVAIERPLDYEISKLEVMEKRRQRLAEKLGRVVSLSEFLENNRIGRNYDYSDLDGFEPFVVSPFIEWIWSREDALWYTADIPRIIAPNEAFELLRL